MKIRMLPALVLAGVAALPALPAAAQNAPAEMTVTSLLLEGYEVKGVFPTSAGPGILLQLGTSLIMCFVAETPQSATIFTQYCKPVE